MGKCGSQKPVASDIALRLKAKHAGKQLWRGVRADRYVRELRKNWK